MTTQAVSQDDDSSTNPTPTERTLFRVLTAVSFCHLINDMLQMVLPAIYPILKTSFKLNFAQIGIITLVFQWTASMLQPIIGRYTDKRPMPYSLPVGMTFTLVGIIVLALAPTFGTILVAAALIGMGSAVFHPESSRVARMASGGRHGLAQSFFQVGGNTGSAIGPLLAPLIVLRGGQIGVLWFAIVGALGIVVLLRVGRWCKTRHLDQLRRPAPAAPGSPLPRRKIIAALAVLICLIFSKYFYLSSMVSFYTLYLITRFGVSTANSMFHLFVFLAAVAAGTYIGGPLGDRYGRKAVIWCSILGVLPFTLLLPHANLFWTGPLSVAIGLILSSAFSAIIVFGQDLLPGRIGMISGLFFGLAFGVAGMGAAVLGKVADTTSIVTVYKICAWLPAIGLLTAFLPNLRHLAGDRPLAEPDSAAGIAE